MNDAAVEVAKYRTNNGKTTTSTSCEYKAKIIESTQADNDTLEERDLSWSKDCTISVI